MTLLEFASVLETTDKKQGFWKLHDLEKDTYCALGVAADAMGIDLTRTYVDDINLKYLENNFRTQMDEAITYLNDQSQWTFKQIAAFIYRKLGAKNESQA